jgi:Flp pilus assembly protein TadG
VTLRALLKSRRAATAVEFAIVATGLITLTIGIVDTGLLFWAKAGLESAAALTARCGATGYTWGTTSCTSTATTQSYAVTTATNWTFASIITTANVTVTSAATSCNGVSGTFFVVTISCPFFSNLPAPLNNYTLSVTACYAQS